MSLDDIGRLFGSLAAEAANKGILSLGLYLDTAADPFLKKALQMVVDGTAPDLVLGTLGDWLESREREYRRKHQTIIKGVMSIQSGDNARWVEEQLAAIY